MLLNEIFQAPSLYCYMGNCTQGHMSPHLEAMMDAAVPVSYGTLMKAVGRQALIDTFPNFDWSQRPRGLTMSRDPNVTYFRSTVDGRRCYYVRESGIEYVFAAEPTAAAPARAKTLVVLRNGEIAPMGPGGSVFTVSVKRGVADIGQSTSKTPEAGAALAKFLHDNEVHTVLDDGEETSASDFIRWLLS